MQALLNLDPIYWALILLSIATLAVSIFKGLQWWSLRNLFAVKATDTLDESIVTKSTLGKKNIRLLLLQQYFAVVNNMKLHGNALETELWRLARAQVNQFGNYLKVLEVVATVAPLVGLLGTVLGMVEAFKAMELAGANVDPAVLSGGIWKALSTTAVGLTVAIPTFILHSWFDRQAENAAALVQNDLECFLAQNAKPTLRAVNG